jgi:hypothetical protein
MWTERYLKNTSQLKFLNNVELTLFLVETLKISVNTKYRNYVRKFITFEVTDRHLTKTLRNLLTPLS